MIEMEPDLTVTIDVDSIPHELSRRRARKRDPARIKARAVAGARKSLGLSQQTAAEVSTFARDGEEADGFMEDIDILFGEVERRARRKCGELAEGDALVQIPDARGSEILLQ